ncbi:hypothetical protein J1N35_000524 [Gossypium stocksii]|uniref:Uncharacterized protein n=1 Tax=Gossypium stocksii TaxID=47602 RepID=A0A9D3WHL8_9ROSI|nr:hypothetical protein J1N35_000524 [Gossypium stocksii]
MEVPPVVTKKSTKKKPNDEPTQWERRLGRNVRYNIRLLEPMKPCMDTFVRSQRAQASYPERLHNILSFNEEVDPRDSLMPHFRDVK